MNVLNVELNVVHRAQYSYIFYISLLNTELNIDLRVRYSKCVFASDAELTVDPAAL